MQTEVEAADFDIDSEGRAFELVSLRNGDVIKVRELTVDEMTKLAEAERAADKETAPRVFVTFMELNGGSDRMTVEDVGRLPWRDFRKLSATFRAVSGDDDDIEDIAGK